MKKFNFRLQSVLDLKGQEEEVIQKELVRLQNKYQKVKEKITTYKEEKYNCQQELEDKEKREFDLNSAFRYRNYIKYLKQEIEELALQLDHWKKKISDCRSRLLDKTKEKKILSKLKEKKQAKHYQEVMSQEQKFNDELATIGFNCKDGGLQESIL